LFQAVDRLSSLVVQLREQGHDQGDASPLLARLQTIVSQPPESPGVPDSELADAEAENASQWKIDLVANDQELESMLNTAMNDDSDNLSGGNLGEYLLDPAAYAPHLFDDITDETEVPPKYLAIFIDE